MTRTTEAVLSLYCPAVFASGVRGYPPLRKGTGVR
jgi:hypothetical protein